MSETEDLRLEIAELHVTVESLTALVNSLRQEVTQKTDVNRRDSDRLLVLVDGDESLGIKGLRKRQDEMDVVIEEYRRGRTMLRGALIALGVTGAGSIGTVTAILTKVFRTE